MMGFGSDVLEEHWTTVRNWRVFARVSERAPDSGVPPVVLVHGLGVSSRYMIPLAVHLASTFHVYAPDLPGFGRTEKPWQALTVRQLAEVLHEWMIAAGLAPALVVGNSMGCQIIAELADIEPDVMSGAVLLGPTMDGTARHPAAHVWRLFKDQFHEPPPLVPLQAFDYFGNGPVRTFQTFLHAVHHNLLARVQSIRARSVIMRGEHDTIVSREWVAALATRMNRVELIEVPGKGHALNYSAPDAVGDVVRKLAAAVR